MTAENDKRKRMSVALEVNNPINLLQALHSITADGFHFIVTNLVHPFNIRDLTDKEHTKIIGRTDRILESGSWQKFIVGRISRSYDVDNEISYIRESEKLLLKQELGFANHLVLPAILLPLTQRNNKNLAHIFYNKFHSGVSFVLWVQIPMKKSKSLMQANDEGDEPWEIWNDFRRIANYHKKLGLALELPKLDNIPTDLELDRWMGEPVRALFIHTSHFLSNPHNQPVLPRVYQDIIKKFMSIDVQYVIQGPANNFTYSQYYNYVNFLGKKLYDITYLREFSVGCEDFLQNPLQPLSDHLETAIYEIFEKDPIKYIEYQNAIRRALEDMPKSIQCVVIMVVGAGRGPLVQAALNASHLTHRKVKVYAVEKNPYAINTLEERIQNEWQGLVTLIHQDMRVCRPPEDADILVSELLGSFGDNELSPECLDGAQRFLKPTGISIPESYTSFLAPLHSTKLHNEILFTRNQDKPVISVYETPYVVHFVNAYQIAPSKALFTFKHPNRDDRIVNERMSSLRFKAPQNCLLTGFSGYFETVLYKEVMLSTNPQTHSPNMVSWFPILFPLAEPVQIISGDVIDVTFWRAENEEKVWYEWCLNSPQRSSIYNVNGRSYFIKK